MRIAWNDQSLQWFHNAAAYTGYPQNLANIIKTYIPEGETLCDVGCGAALVDFALADYCSDITCVDIAPAAIEHVQHQVDVQGISNIHPLCSDVSKLSGSWDTVMALFFGGGAICVDAFPLVRKRFILIRNSRRKANFGPEGYNAEHCRNSLTTHEYLAEQHIRYTYHSYAVEHGQPFVDMSEAHAFLDAYARPMPLQVRDDYLASTLEEIDHPTWRYYLPHTKQFDLFVIERDDNEHLLK